MRGTRPPILTPLPILSAVPIAVRAALVAAALFTLSSCHKDAGPGPSPVPTTPVLQCPANVLVELVTETSAVVNYSPPLVSGGAQPVAVTCAAPSGSQFGLGASPVTCTATDSMSRQAQCVFSVNVALIPQLRGTKIVAFGDSITAGEVSPAVSVLVVDPVNNYPTVLGGLLTSRYKAQPVTVLNVGIPGEKLLTPATPGGQIGEDRLEDVVEREKPDVLIVLEGVNDINSGATPHAVAEGLRRGVRRAVRANVPLVIISTILPGVEGRQKPPNPDRVNDLNAEIRSWAASERAVLVDSYAAFLPQKESLIGVDGLHPTVAGYKMLADTMLAAIRSNFELPPPAGAVPTGFRKSR